MASRPTPSVTVSSACIFVSSTSVDLHAHRARVKFALERLDQHPVVMETFGAHGTGDATSVATDKVAGSDVYIGLVAWRYGYVPDGQMRSVTHQEYDEATRLDLPRYIFLAAPTTDAPDGPDALFPASVRDPEHRAQLDAFRAQLGKARVVDCFITPDDLALKVATSVHAYLLQRAREAERTPTARVPRQLPQRAAEFVGREHELGRLLDTLRHGQSVGLSAAVAGMAGVGKSALAAEALHVLVAEPDAFPGGIAFVRCDGRTGLDGLAWVEDQVLAAWDITLTPEALGRAATPETAVELREQALRAHFQPGGDGAAPAPALVLLDNVERDLPVGRALETLGITVLVTSRHQPLSPLLRLLPLDVLDPEASRILFAERYADRGGQWDPARDAGPAGEVVEVLGRLPLAIELAAARAARAETGVAALAAELGEADRLGKLRDPLDPTYSVRYVLERSLDTLSVEQRLRFVALGMPDGPDWPRAVVEHLLAALPPDAPAGSDQASAADDLEAMVALSLVTLVAPSAGSAASTSSTAALGVRVRLHPLVRELAGAQWTSHPEAMQRAGLEALLAAVAELVEEQADDFAALNQEEALIAGVLRRAAQAHLAPTQVVAAISSLARYLTVGGHWRLGMELFTLQLAIQREVGDRAGEGEKLNNLGYLASDLGHKEEAARYYEQALAIFDAIGAVDSARVVRDNLAAIAQDHVAAGDSSSDQEISDHPVTLAEVVDEGDDAGQVAAPSPEPPSVLVEVHRPFPTMCRRVRRQNTCESGRLICSSLCARMRTRWGQG